MENQNQNQPQKPIITESTAHDIENEFETRERENLEKVEASLFIAGKFLTLQELIMLTDLNPIMLKEILNKLEKKYSRGVLRIVNRNNSWKMDIAEKYHYIINRLATGNTEFTKSEQETLAIIAYKQPIKQSVVIKIRGNKSYEHIKKFRELGLVKAVKSGHTNILTLSEEFYEYFNLQKKEQQENIGEE
ncbi:MAG: SMC-Scp complex subunit ScpB [archaeon]